MSKPNVIPMPKRRKPVEITKGTIGWTYAVEKVLGKMPTGYGRDSLTRQAPQRVAIRREIEAEYGQPIPARIVAGSAEAREIADAVMRCYYRANPGAAEDAIEEARRSLHESKVAAFDRALAKAVAAANASLRLQFKAAVDARCDEVRASVAAHEAELDERDAALQRREKTLISLMTYEDFRLIRSCLHPDRLTSVDPERLRRAFQIFDALEKNVNPHMPVAVLRSNGWGDYVDEALRRRKTGK